MSRELLGEIPPGSALLYLLLVCDLENSSPCARIEKKQGEQLRQHLIGLALLDKTKRIEVEGNFLFLPLIEDLKDEIKLEVLTLFNSAEFTTRKFETFDTQSKKLIDFLSHYFNQDELTHVPRSLDVIGEIAIIEIPNEILDKEKLLAEKMLEYNKSIKSIFSKFGNVDGEYRIRQLKFLAGKNETVTIHKENGCRYELDIKKVYFSPRLSTEHARIAEMARSDELILDMFAGIGPFSILIARRKGSKVHAVDKNQDAIHYLKKNIELNKVENLVIPYLGDVKELVSNVIKEKFDRIIMNLPGNAFEFLQTACMALKSSGGTIHLYMFKTQSDTLEELEGKIRKEIQKFRRQVSEIKIRKVKSTAPYEWQICVDIKIGKN